MTTSDRRPPYRVIYVGAARELGRKGSRANERRSQGDEEAWGQRLAKEQEEACQEMARQGLRLSHVVPVQTSSAPASLQGPASWTAGVWLYFTGIEPPTTGERK
jgi:hypothetical protein